MPEPSTTTAAGAAITVGTIQAALGIDPVGLLWGLGGGLVALSAQEPLGRARAIMTVSAAAVFAGALAQIAAHYLGHWLPDLPPLPVRVGVAFALGLVSQRSIPVILVQVPAAIGRLLGRVSNEQRGE